MKALVVKKRSDDFLEFTTPIILEETKTTRRCFYGALAKDHPDGEWSVRGTFVLERKGPTGWHAQEGATLQRLSGGEVAKLELRREHIRKLLMGLEALAEAATVNGIELRSTKLVVGREEELVHVVEKEHKTIIEHLIQGDKVREKSFGTPCVWLGRISQSNWSTVKYTVREVRLYKNSNKS
jgi:hypothetical protein